MRTTFFTVLMFAVCLKLNAADIVFKQGETITYSIEGEPSLVVGTAIRLFTSDLKTVLNADLKTGRKANIVIKTLSAKSHDALVKKSQGFRIEEKHGRIYVTGADAQGTAYGVMELSRLLGVSPWAWWADNVPVKKGQWTVGDGFCTEQSPAVEYRGIFINDEDNAFTPWVWKTYEPSKQKGRIGPKTHERVFELMLRLRANLFWPAMHSCSSPFYSVEGNREMADRYSITIGTSHCEPMLRNTNGEWSERERGEYNYVANREGVLRFWEERVKETAKSGGIYTLGMRGKHDTGMEGVETLDERQKYLQHVIDDQRAMLKKYVSDDVATVPQVFIPYKEVLEVYKAGLSVPDDVTLMWCDDNYGYIRHLPDSTELARKGGNAVYYHFSYWGRPQSHVWIPSIAPTLAQTELLRAYNHGIRKMWVFNVGDIKPLEFITEYGLDMAWSTDVMADRDSGHYMLGWLKREFGDELGKRLLPVMQTYYELSYRCRAENLGHTRVEEADARWKCVSDLPWSDDEVNAYLQRAKDMERMATELKASVDERHKAQYFEIIEYPCRALSAMARKMLTAQLARHGKAEWTDALAGQTDIFSLRDEYNRMLDGKWNGMAGFWTGHSIYRQVDTTQYCAPIESTVCSRLTSDDGQYGAKSYVIPNLGYSRRALYIEKGEEFITTLPAMTDSMELTFAFVPNHPVDGDSLEVAITLDGQQEQRLHYETQGRSEEWKQNVERNQARRTIIVPPSSTERRLKVRALTPAVIFDELTLNRINKP